MVILGAVLFVIPFFFAEKQSFFTWIYAIPILVLAVFILVNKKEDKIEEIKKVKGGKK